MNHKTMLTRLMVLAVLMLAFTRTGLPGRAVATLSGGDLALDESGEPLSQREGMAYEAENPCEHT
jgi:hypothetical protein